MSAVVGRLHVLTDETLQHRFSHRELASLAFQGGADTVQLREKGPVDDAQVTAWARTIRREARRRGALLIVDDRIAVARASDADGVHLGREDVSPADARKLLGWDVLIGGTANSLEEALRVADGPVDYLGVGPLFGTTSKARPVPPLGLRELSRIAAAVDKPVVAIGKLGPDHVWSVLDTGVHGIAVLSGVVCSPDPAAATARYRSAIEQHERGHGARRTM